MDAAARLNRLKPCSYEVSIEAVKDSEVSKTTLTHVPLRTSHVIMCIRSIYMSVTDQWLSGAQAASHVDQFETQIGR
jgi:hypothetical protein